ncbi:MAG TPA: T9SS type A sorting domain-containing protein [Ignavibacteriaceae bacterium]
MKYKITAIFIYSAFSFLFASNLEAQSYVLLGWNDLGMHCANKDFSKIAVLPPYNNIYAQLIKNNPGSSPQVVTANVSVEYSIPGNSYSVGKTNFWTYAQQLFNLPQPLPDNIGLTGKGLTGTLEQQSNYFFARGIPVTPYQDDNLILENPFQLIHLTARDLSTSAVLAETDVVIPVSNEIGCVQAGCHSSEQSILDSHEDAVLTPPVLCAGCHADNALGTPGNGEAPIFSDAIHGKHADIGLPPTLETCYKCHPGPNTQCLRDVMSQSGNMICEDCHGTLTVIANSISNGRRPWLDEPRCGNSICHGSTFSEETGKLFRESQGHGGLLCSACHGSPHAILPSREANDNLQNIILQGTAGTLASCPVCHGDNPTSGGPHNEITIIAENHDLSLSKFELLQNYPNPFNNSTLIKYSIPGQTPVKLKIYNILGETVSIPVDGIIQSGNYEMNFNAAELSSGIYFYQLRAGSYTAMKKMLLLK